MKHQKLMHADLCHMIPAGNTGMSREEKDGFVSGELDKQSFLQGGKVHHELNIRISNYAERSKLAQNNIPTKYIKTFTDRGMGINVKIFG